LYAVETDKQLNWATATNDRHRPATHYFRGAIRIVRVLLTEGLRKRGYPADTVSLDDSRRELSQALGSAVTQLTSCQVGCLT